MAMVELRDLDGVVGRVGPHSAGLAIALSTGNLNEMQVHEH